MNRRLIYVVGPSGAGKDSVLSWLRQHTPLAACVHWAKRTIDRPLVDAPLAEQHQAVNAATFEHMARAGAFVMQWDANSHRYGIGVDELKHLEDPSWCVMVNGSRAHLPVAALAFPGLTVLHVTASRDVLRQRLLGRGRESAEAVDARLQRHIAITIPPGSFFVEIHNDTTLEAAGEQLLDSLKKLGLWQV